LMGSNLKAPMFLSQAAAPELKKRRGCIINITDIHADRPMKSYVVYSVAKAGLVGLTKSLARELAPEVRVNGIAPGPIMWPEGDSNFDQVSRQRIVSHTMLKRAGDPTDIALAVRFFAMDTHFVTGQILAVDGGRSAKL
jgi:pteridine reductase